MKDVMSADSDAVDPELSLQEFVHEHLLRTGRRFFLVIQDGQLLGAITPNEVRTVESRAWPFTPVRSVMRSADKIHSVSPDIPAMEALETMGAKTSISCRSCRTAELTVLCPVLMCCRYCGHVRS